MNHDRHSQSLNEQMLDLCALAHQHGLVRASEWIRRRSFTFPAAVGPARDRQLREQVEQTRLLAIRTGCDDACAWLTADLCITGLANRLIQIA